jgi:hypothetical protein
LAPGATPNALTVQPTTLVVVLSELVSFTPSRLFAASCIRGAGILGRERRPVRAHEVLPTVVEARLRRDGSTELVPFWATQEVHSVSLLKPVPSVARIRLWHLPF